MKKKVEVLAVGNRITGTKVGKNGNSFKYDFVNVSILYDGVLNADFDGCKMGEVVGIDYPIFEQHPLRPGDVVSVEMWIQNYKTKVGAIYEE